MARAAARREAVVVIGAGLSGLTAAIAVARRGRRVTVIERLDRAGGLCGERVEGDAVFVRGGLEYMHGLYRRLEALGVPLRWFETRTRLCFGGRSVTLPVQARELPFWVGAGPQLLRAGRRLSRSSEGTLRDVFQALRSPPAVQRVFAGLLLPGALTFDQLSGEDIRSMTPHMRGDVMHRQAMAVGGPQVITDALVATLQRLGGTLRLGVSCGALVRDGDEIAIPTSDGELRAAHVLTSQPRWDAFPSGSRAGLHLGQILVKLSRPVTFPDGLHALYHVPEDVDTWHAALQAGEWCDDMGCTLVNPMLGDTPERQTLIGYVPVPRGVRALAPDVAVRRLGALLARFTRAIPGLYEAVASARLVLPDEFVALNGLEPAPALRIPPPDGRRPAALDPVTGAIHLGGSVDPPGLHGAAIVRTAIAAAERITGP